MRSRVLTFFFVIALMTDLYGAFTRKIGTIITRTNNTPALPFFKRTPPLLETKASYFFFASSKTNKVYRNGGFQVQLSGSYPIWKELQVYRFLID